MSENANLQLADYIRAIPDFPKPGILFRDITPLLASPVALAETVRRLAEHFRDSRIDFVAAAEARGVLFAVPLAMALDAGVVPIRKPGKLPHKTVSEVYELEYGSDKLEMHGDAVTPGARVLVLDDLLATGGTVAACCRMIEKAGGTVVGCAFVIELTELAGAEKLTGYDVVSRIKF